MSRRPGRSLPRTVGRLALGAFLTFAGTAHLTFARDEFQAQVPSWVPVDTDLVVVGSGVVEVGLGLALLAPTRPRWRQLVGWLTGAFFVAICPATSPSTSRARTVSAWTPIARA